MSAIENLKDASPEEEKRLRIDSLKLDMDLRRQAKREFEAESQGAAPQLRVVGAHELPSYQFPLREALLFRDQTAFFRAGHIGEVFAMRGVGKTWLMLTLGLIVSTGKRALGFHSDKPRRVLYIDGEMASEDIRQRLMHLSEQTKMPLTDHLQVLGADWQSDYLPRLDTELGQQAVEPFVEPADLIMLDNRSCLFDPEGEKDATAWQPAGDWLLSLRRRGKGVLAAHHANRQGGARGHSKAEDAMDLILKLTRPEEYSAEEGARFVVEVEKGRGLYGPAAAPFIAALTASGWQVDVASTGNGALAIRAKIIEYLRVAEAARDSPKSANVAISKAKVNRTNGLKVWAEMLQNGEIVGDKQKGYCVGVLRQPPF